LCFGWIEGVRRRIDDISYSIRFTPRRRGSIWSNVNTKRVGEFIREKRMRPAGLKAFAARDPEKSGIYSFERETATLPPQFEKVFRANRKAWKFWEGQPPGYKRLGIHFVVSAKQADTRQRRLERLIRDSAKGLRFGIARPPRVT
jgi:uncharacterized protein YdeI (YjbR/CyaY-like superfamily)